MKTYELKFHPSVLRQWQELDPAIRRQFQKKLEKVVVNPHIASARLHGFPGSYRLKLRKAGFRLGYRVFDDAVVVVVIAVGRRDKDEIYRDFAQHYHAGYP